MRDALRVAVTGLADLRTRAIHYFSDTWARICPPTISAPHRRILAGSAVAGIAVLFAATGLIAARLMARTTSVAATADVWQADALPGYLVICNACKARANMDSPPTRTLRKQAGMLQCPHCGAFAAASYRRGSLTVPPGGW